MSPREQNKFGKAVKPRGRKKIDDEEYKHMAYDKINEWQEMLKSNKISNAEKRMIRNRIQAQISRNRKKEEATEMNKKIDEMKKKY